MRKATTTWVQFANHHATHLKGLAARPVNAMVRVVATRISYIVLVMPRLEQ